MTKSPGQGHISLKIVQGYNNTYRGCCDEPPIKIPKGEFVVGTCVELMNGDGLESFRSLDRDVQKDIVDVILHNHKNQGTYQKCNEFEEIPKK